MTIPAWTQSAVFYQIFPDRFANGDPGNDPVNVRPWDTPPTVKGFWGGDLVGITQRLDYLTGLGVNAIYLNPIFQAASNHRYDTIDYLRIDPKLGRLEDFQRLIAEAHRRGVRVVLDGVFNHCSRGFFAFYDIMENGSESPYLDWFHVKKLPLRAYEPGKARNYEGWWGMKWHPKFNTHNPGVRSYIMEVARYWMEQGADGWRLDVPNEIDDDDFWAEFRQVVRAANPEAYLIGEIWDVNPRWANDTHFDGLMNYPLRTAILDLLCGRITSTTFGQQVDALMHAYPRENVHAMYNLLGSHDRERLLTHFDGDARKVNLGSLLLFAMPGVPAVYYGDEVGLTGPNDPGCRGAFPWDENRWNRDILAHTQAVIAARQASQALQTGDYLPITQAGSREVVGLARRSGTEVVIALGNPTYAAAEAVIPVEALGLAEGQPLHDLLGGPGAEVRGGLLRLHLEPLSGAYLTQPRQP